VHWLHLEPTHLLYYTGYTRSPLTYCTTLATLGAHSPTVLHWLHLEPTHQYYTGYTSSLLTQTHVPYDLLTQTHVPYDLLTQTHVPYDLLTQTHVPYDLLTQTHVPYDVRPQCRWERVLFVDVLVVGGYRVQVSAECREGQTEIRKRRYGDIDR
jgi:hypothetical protein